MNLLNNAVDALKSQTDPRIECSLQRWDVDAEFRSRHGIAADCIAMAHIQIADNGIGIGDEDQEKIFEPFFSTKEVGKGTGLGLAMVYGSVQTHGGVIEVESRRGRGSCFHLYFPLVEQEGDAQRFEKLPVSAGGCGETILLVDDEQELRHTIAEVLQSLGYRVYQAGDGREALEQLHEHADQIALVITDIIMPKMGGIALARAIRNDDPDLPIILATGYDKQRVLSKEQLPNCMEISKPFDFDLLSKQIRAFLKQ